ncbi:MAG TPA: YdeI/OmpD-associated family protein [Candidatus Saccharimonadia bacterium]|nr:YdeI/OmpD-associated family protein [Candidatus Saccharimonadia bacterium]
MTSSNLPKYEIGNPGPERDRLIELVKAGVKVATTGLLAEYQLDGLHLPQPGARFALMDSTEQPIATIEITRAKVMKLGEADEQVARDEGEGFSSVADWRGEHECFWNAYIDDLRQRLYDPDWRITDDTEIVVEWFRLVKEEPDGVDLKDGLPILAFANAPIFEVWVAEHGTDAGLWLKIAKKAFGIATVSYAEAVDVALCYGWIDGQKQSYDEQYFLQKFTPRRPKSIWSQVNVAKVAALTAVGRMKPPGLAAVAAAQADGRWDQAYASARTMAMPPDFAAALEANPIAKEFYATLNKTNTYAILWRIETAKKPETRQARITKLIALLNERKAIH